jgi:hypothetical protein
MCPMKSQVATTVSGHVFAYPKVTSVSASGSLLQPQAPRPAAQDVTRIAAAAAREPLWPIEFAAAA